MFEVEYHMPTTAHRIFPADINGKILTISFGMDR